MKKLLPILISILLFLCSCGQSKDLLESSGSTTSDINTSSIETTSTTVESSTSTESQQTTSTSIISIETKPQKEVGIKWKVPLVMQNPELPTGCEITSITMVVNFYGYDYDKITMTDKYLDKSDNFYYDNGQLFGPNPQKFFLGNPRSTSGYGLQCFSGTWVNTLNKVFEENKSEHYAEDISGRSLEDLEGELQSAPILISASIDMNPASPRVLFKDSETKEDVTTYRNFHCVVLVGYDEDYYYVNDPLGTFSKLEKARLERAYTSTGQQAVIVR